MYYLGIDIGGTGLKAGLVDEAGTIVARKSVPVDAKHPGFDHYLAEELASLTKQLLFENDLSVNDIPYVGIGVPGPCDDKNGLFLFAPNLPVRNMELRRLFQEQLDIPVRLGNDANCAALGEYRVGAGKQYSSMVLITLGTGVGTGIILDGKMWTGCNGVGAEGGHMVVRPGGLECGCGRKGCFEVYASASGLIRMAVEQMRNDKDSLLWSLADGAEENVTGRIVFRAAEEKDPTAEKVLDEYIDVLSEGCLDIINLLQPEVVVLGGGISGASDALLLEPLRERTYGRDMAKYSLPKTTIVKAELGNDAGIIGAAFLGA